MTDIIDLISNLFLQSLFSVNPCRHPIVILKDVHFEDLQTVVQFMYNGVVNVSSEKLPAVLKVRRDFSVTEYVRMTSSANRIALALV